MDAADPRKPLFSRCVYAGGFVRRHGAYPGRKAARVYGSFVSMGMVCVAFLPFYGRNAIQALRTLARHDRLMLLMQAVFGIVLFRLFLLVGMRYTGAAEAGVLTGTTPAFTAAFAFLFLKERPSGFTVLGIGCTAAGILFLQNEGIVSIRFTGNHLLGNALILCAAASESTFNILSRRFGTRLARPAAAPMHPMVQTLLIATIALLLTAVPALFERPFAALAALGLQEWIALFWYSIVVTAIAFALFYAGAKRCGAYAIAAYSGLMPLTAVLLSVALLGETIAWVQWIGAGLVVLGILFIGQKRRGLHAYH